MIRIMAAAAIAAFLVPSFVSANGGAPVVGLEELIQLEPALTCNVGMVTKNGYGFVTIGCMLEDGRPTTSWYVYQWWQSPPANNLEQKAARNYEFWHGLIGSSLSCRFDWVASFTPICRPNQLSLIGS